MVTVKVRGNPLRTKEGDIVVIGFEDDHLLVTFPESKIMGLEQSTRLISKPTVKHKRKRIPS